MLQSEGSEVFFRRLRIRDIRPLERWRRRGSAPLQDMAKRGTRAGIG